MRYIPGHGSKLLAETSIVINAVSATLRAPKTVNMNSEAEIQWAGPGNKEDYIRISRTDQKASRYVTYQYVNRGDPCKHRTPKEAGPYEVRYILGRGKKILATTSITVRRPAEYD